MKRSGAILIPMLGGFLLTVAVVSWRSGWWQQRAALAPVAGAPVRVEVRRSNLRVVPVHISTGTTATSAVASAAAFHPIPAPAAPEAAPELLSAPYVPPPVPRTDPGNSPERLDASARKFAHGSRADED